MQIKVDKFIRNHKPAKHGGIFSNVINHNTRLIDFSSNVNPLGCPNAVKKILNMSYVSRYPDSNSTELRNHLEKYAGISKNNIVVGNGATEIIYNFCNVFLKNQQILIPIPTFSEYETAAKLNQARLNFFKTMDLNQDLSEFSDNIRKMKCVFLCNPNNPTGVLLKKQHVLKILESAKNSSSLVFLDECFIELVPQSNESVLNYLREFENLFILRSLTKSFGLAGLRIGYGLGSKKIINILQNVKIPWNVGEIAQKASSKALSDKSHIAKTLTLINKESKFLIDSISEINGYTCYPSSTNFILIKSKISSTTIQKKLLTKNILIRDCKSFHGLDNHFIRIAIKTRKENLKLVNALKTL